MKMMLGDRIKVLVLIALFIVLSAAYLHSSIPIMSFWEALQDQLRAKWWLVVLFGLEVLRQLHYLDLRALGRATTSSGRSTSGAPGTGAWTRSTRGGATGSTGCSSSSVFTIIAGLILAWKWGTTFIEAIAEAPGPVLRHPVREPDRRPAAVLHADHHRACTACSAC